MKIVSLFALEILDSRGFPTIEVHIVDDLGFRTYASVPSGASVGSLEMPESRDGDSSRFKGKGVLNAVNFINNNSNIILRSFDSQKEFDSFVLNLVKERLLSIGSNITIALSIAFARLNALRNKVDLSMYLQQESLNHINRRESSGLSLKTEETAQKREQNKIQMPTPMINILNGGKHADNPIQIQEFMIIPFNASSFTESITIGGNIFHALRDVLKRHGLNTNVGDEGGFGPNLKDPREAFDLIIDAINLAGYNIGKDILLGIDCAASEFFDEKTKKYNLYHNDNPLDGDKMIDFYREISKDYFVFSIEDPFSEHDIYFSEKITSLMKDQIQIVGDDLFVTNINVFKQRKNAGNAILIKPNQIGTVSDALEVITEAYLDGFNCIASHRSGETEDTFIADFAFGTLCNQIKTGSLSRSDRNCKYNQLIRIENHFKQNNIDISFSGGSVFEKFITGRKK